MLYEVITDCLDLNLKFRKKGERVNVPDGQPVPKWFKPVGKVEEVQSKQVQGVQPHEQVQEVQPNEQVREVQPNEQVQEVRNPVEDDPRVEYKTLMAMNKDELLELAGKEGVDIPVGVTKAEIVRLIRTYRQRNKVTRR